VTFVVKSFACGSIMGWKQGGKLRMQYNQLLSVIFRGKKGFLQAL
jgi:hypothetical protein